MELLRALAKSDAGVYRHSLAVAATARAVGARLGLTGVELARVELGGLLHDVGKVRIPRDVLSKPGPLTPEERRLVRMHPQWGAEMVAGIPELEAVAPIVRLHHERPDGCGYPYGLTGEQIPLAARIVAVCDAYGAMTHGRPYRASLDTEEALCELERHASTQFDPDAVVALTRFVRRSEPIPA